MAEFNCDKSVLSDSHPIPHTQPLSRTRTHTMLLLNMPGPSAAQSFIRESGCHSHLHQTTGVWCACVCVPEKQEKNRQTWERTRARKDKKGVANMTQYVNQTSMVSICNYRWGEKSRNAVMCLRAVSHPRRASWGPFISHAINSLHSSNVVSCTHITLTWHRGWKVLRVWSVFACSPS